MITKLQLCLLGVGAWLGMQACMFVHDDACVKDSDCKNGRICSAGTCSDTDGSVPADGEVPVVPNMPNAQCTAQTETDRYQGLFGPNAGVPMPPECTTDTLEGPYTGKVAPFDDGYDSNGHNAISARISGTSLVELAGVPCQA